MDKYCLNDDHSPLYWWDVIKMFDKLICAPVMTINFLIIEFVIRSKLNLEVPKREVTLNGENEEHVDREAVTFVLPAWPSSSPPLECWLHCLPGCDPGGDPSGRNHFHFPLLLLFSAWQSIHFFYKARAMCPTSVQPPHPPPATIDAHKHVTHPWFSLCLH